MSDPLLRVDALRAGHPGHAPVGPVTLALASGDIVAVLGPNGVGKTTVFRTLIGALPALAGTVCWQGFDARSMSDRQRGACAAWVPQRPSAAFDLSVLQYVQLGGLSSIGPLRAPGPATRHAADAALERLGLSALRNRVIGHVSDGERQLVALARALVQRASVLLLDEPAASLDFSNRERVLQVLASLAEEGLAVMFSTHDPNDALRIAPNVLLMGRGQQPSFGPTDRLVRPEPLSAAYGARLQEAVARDGRRVITSA